MTAASARAPASEGDARLFAFRRNVVVAASAGTGKTHRLAALYVLVSLGLTSRGERSASVAAPPCSPSRVVATTFSRAAAREMRSRIEAALAELARWDGSSPRPFEEILGDREAVLGAPLDERQLRERARAALAELPGARIDTLHGFAGDIVRAHALSLGAPPGARMLEEDEARRLGDRAVDAVLNDAFEAGGPVAAAARALVAACSGVGFARREIASFLDRLDEEGLEVGDLALSDHTADVAARGAELHATAQSLGVDASPELREVAEPLARALELAGWAAGPGTWSDELDRLLRELFSVRLPAEKKRTHAEQALFDLKASCPGKNRLERAARLGAYLREAPGLQDREQGVRDLCVAAHRRLATDKRHAGVLGFGDVLRFAHRGLLDDPDLAQRVRQSADVLLVDELQDTSRVQRDLVYLARERPDSGRRRGERPSPRHLESDGLFLVGDRKQSIYGFRGVDVSIFSEVCAELAGVPACEALLLPSSMASEHPVADFVALRETRRSGPAITRFVNTMSEIDLRSGRAPDEAPLPFEIDYGPAERLVAAGPEGDEVVLVRDDRAIPEDADALVREATGPAREAFIAAAYVAADATSRRDLGEPVRWSDVAILTRRRSTIPLVELALGRLGIPYVVAGRALYQASEVRDLAAILRLVLDPRDRAALATSLRGPAACLSDQALATLSEPGRGLTVPLEAVDGRRPTEVERLFADREAHLAPDDRERLARFRERFSSARATLLRSPPAESLALAIRVFEIDRVVAALPRAAARLGNLERLVGIARRHAKSLATFSRWLDRQIADEVDEAEAVVFSADDDAVRVTTIHGSKGLDFPRVVLVDLGAGPGIPRVSLALHPDRTSDAPPRFVMRHVDATGETIPTSASRSARAVGTLRERAERRRLTYVAITRARRALVLIGSDEARRRDSAMAALVAGLEGPLEGAISRTLWAGDVLGSATPTSSSEAAPGPPGRTWTRPSAAPIRVVRLATTTLGLYRGCPRRFELRCLLGLDEPVASGQLDLFDGPREPVETPRLEAEGDPREVGRAAHRVLEHYPASAWGEPTSARRILELLEAEGLAASAHTEELARGIASFLSGAYAHRVRESGARLLREEAFVLPIERDGRRALHLRGAIDLAVLFPDGTADVVDYKDSKPTEQLDRYAFQLRSYALVASRRFRATAVRAGVLFLGTSEPRFLEGSAAGGALDEVEHEALEEELTRLADRFAEDRYAGAFPGIELSSCRRLACGFVTACHGGRARRG